ncbi:ribosomal protein S18-alanine N-acetyltransferase [Breoghania sp. L-A4]|uniref:ribosomal protein S18-alanine N-acetyltransferase n=1 Tax=Breoghania sp. L-A4 TaxID=2304600 RepID=UPI00202B8500|nr:ribosomal protein S18-alanine N-acetyltransferase [Breoghania sp. L-A4]
MPKVIEEALPEDAAALSEIHGRSFSRTWSADEIASFVADPAVMVLVARRASPGGTRQPLGFAILRTAADEAEVLTIAVDPRHRGRGYGRMLLEEAIRRLYADRVAALFLEVDAANRPALALYRALGFARVGERRGYYSGSGDAGATGSGTGAAPITPEDGLALVMRCDLR